VAMIAMGTVGYSSRLTSPKRSLVLPALVLVFSVVLVLIADLDRPGQGLVEVNQASMHDIRKSMAQ